MRLKQNLRHLIEQRGWTAAALSRLSNTPKQTLADWLAGVSPKDLTAVKRVATALSVTVDDLCFADLPQPSSTEIERYLDEIHAGRFEVVLRRIKK